MRARLTTFALLLGLLAIAAPAAADHGHHGGHGHVGVSVGWYGPGWYGGWYGAGWYGPGWYGAGWYGPGYAPVAVQTVPTDVGIVDTDISPEHARVFLDGDLIGTADDFDGYPSYLFLRPGTYTIEFKLQGYRSESLTLDVREGRFFPLDIKLARVPGEPAAPWYDRPKGLPVGRVFGPAPEAKAERQAASQPGPDTSLRPELEQQGEQPAPAVPRLGAALELKVTPENASVYIDGEFLGTAGELARLERGVAVTPGQHQIEVMAPGHAPRTVAVTVPQGERRQVVVELETRAGQS